MPSPLREYQLEAVNQAYHAIKAFGGFYFVHDPGMGKSLEAITLVRLLRIKRLLIICPVVAKGVWDRELAKWWPRHIEDGLDLMLYSWDQAVAYQKELCVREPELTIYDEFHYAKNPQSDRGRMATQLGRWSIYNLGLSGTPQHNELDLFNQYRILAKDEPLFKQSPSDFRRSMVVMFGPTTNWPKKDKGGNLVFKPGAREMLLETIAPYTHTADASLMQLEEPIITEVPVTMQPTEEAAYADMETNLRAELPDGSRTQAEIVLTKLLRLTQITAGHATNTEGDPVRLGWSKLEATMELLDQRPHSRVVIACRFREDIAGLVSVLNERGRPCAKIDGDTPARFRTQYEDWFERGKHDNGVLLLQYQAGGVAITLASARTLILYTLDPSVIRYRQMIGRVWRIGQTNAVEILPLLAEGTQDWAMWESLKAGADNANMSKALLRYLHR